MNGLAWSLLVICCLQGIATVGPAEDAATKHASGQIAELVQKYAKSVNEADARLAAEVWDDSDDVTFIHPRGHEHGWKEVKANFYEKTMGAMFAERKLAVRDLSIHVQGDFAWAEFYWDFEAKLKQGGMPLNSKGRETQVYRRIDQRWVIVHVHYSGMPVTGERRGF
jgi:ketosteroid isomerase-like protein